MFLCEKKEQILLYVDIAGKRHVVLFDAECPADDKFHLFQHTAGCLEYDQCCSSENLSFYGLTLFFERFLTLTSELKSIQTSELKFTQTAVFDDRLTGSKTFIVQMQCPEDFQLSNLEKSVDFQSVIPSEPVWPKRATEQVEKDCANKLKQRIKYIEHDPIPRACFPKVTLTAVPVDELIVHARSDFKKVITYQDNVMQNGCVRPLRFFMGNLSEEQLRQELEEQLERELEQEKQRKAPHSPGLFSRLFRQSGERSGATSKPKTVAP